MCGGFVAAIFLAYSPCWNGGFFFDDDLHLVNNPVLKAGGLAKIWVPGGYLNYWPLTYTAYWLQDQLWGLNAARLPFGEHRIARRLSAARVASSPAIASAGGDVRGGDLRTAPGER